MRKYAIEMLTGAAFGLILGVVMGSLNGVAFWNMLDYLSL